MTDRFEAIAELIREAVREEVANAIGGQAVTNVQSAMPGAVVEQDPWQNGSQPPVQAPWPDGAQPAARPQQPWQQPAQAPVQQQPAAPSCQHGPLKIVPGGFSQRTQKAYSAFWACQAPQGQQCQLNQKQLPPTPA
jgi:hypothetical protein